MATKKPATKKAAPAAKATKAAAAPKATKAPAKATAVKKAAPVKAAPAKPTAPAKKAAPAKAVAKPAAKKPAEAKPAATKPVAPAKKAAEPVVAKKAASAAKASETAKKVAPKAAPQVIKKAASALKAKKPIIEAPSPASKPLILPVKKLEVKKKEEKSKTPVEVKIPPMSSTGVATYQPDFTKSVLDAEPQKPSSPTMRYSDSELNEFKELIQRKLESARKELNYLQGLITRKDDLGGDESDGRYMTMEDGSVSMEREQLSQMASRQITFIDHLEKALRRIESKTYGICRVTGQLIDKARLRAVPHATLSVEAKQMMAKQGKTTGQ